MRKTTYILLLFTLGLCVVSCTPEEVDFRNGTESEKIVIESVLSPSADINITKLSTSVVINAEVQDIEHPFDAAVMIRNVGTGDNNMSSPSDINGCYLDEFSNIVEGNTYELTASIPDSELRDVFASTTVPFRTDIENIEIVEIDTIYNVDLVDRYGLRFTYEITIGDVVQQPAFFRLITSRNDVFLDGSGNQITRSLDKIPFNNFDFVHGANACHDLEHRDGVLINHSKLSDSKFTISFYTDDDLRIGTDVVPNLFFELQTVEEDFYHYFLSTSRQLKAHANGSSQPVSAFNNVTNGLGVFTSYSETIDTVQVQ